jgi:hypothetical protein
MATNSSDRAAPREMPKPRRVARESDANVVVDATASATARDDATTPPTPTLTHLGFVNDATTNGVKYVSEHALTSKVMGAYAGARDATALKVREYSLFEMMMSIARADDAGVAFIRRVVSHRASRGNSSWCLLCACP